VSVDIVKVGVIVGVVVGVCVGVDVGVGVAVSMGMASEFGLPKPLPTSFGGSRPEAARLPTPAIPEVPSSESTAGVPEIEAELKGDPFGHTAVQN